MKKKISFLALLSTILFVASIIMGLIDSWGVVLEKPELRILSIEKVRAVGAFCFIGGGIGTIVFVPLDLWFSGQSASLRRYYRRILDEFKSDKVH